eukprot:gene4113-5863_t
MRAVATHEHKRILFVSAMVDTIGWSIVLPTLPGLHSRLNISNINISFISSSISIVTFFGGIFQGKLSDSIGRIRMLQLSAISQLLGHLLVLGAIYFNSIELYILGRILPAMFKCGMVVSQAYLIDIDDNVSIKENIGKDMSTLVAFTNLAFIIGPIFGGFAYNFFPFLPFSCGIFISFLNLILLHILQTQAPNNPLLVTSSNNNNIQTDSSICDKEGLIGNSMQSSSNMIVMPSSGNSVGNVYKRISAAAKQQQNERFLNYLHVKFSFQISNTLFEALLPQHAKNQLQLSESYIGGLLGYTGALSAISNGFIIKKILLNENPSQFLLILSIVTALGLYIWVVSFRLAGLIFSVTIVTISSNLFLGIIQYLITKELQYSKTESSLKVADRSYEDSGIIEGKTLANESKSIFNKLFDSNQQNSKHSSSSKSLQNKKIGMKFGMMSAVDRAAKIIAPLIGGILFERYSNNGLLLLVFFAFLYCFVLTIRTFVTDVESFASLLSNAYYLFLKSVGWNYQREVFSSKYARKRDFIHQIYLPFRFAWGESGCKTKSI